jgi:hypothetical protein
MKAIRFGIFLLALVAVLEPSMAVVLPGQHTTPDQSLPYNLQLATNLTEPDTVVIAVANPTDFSVIAIADEIANKVVAPVLVTPPDRLSNYVIETVTQMLAYGNVEKAIVVGTSNNTTSIADIVRNINEPLTGKNINLVNVIYASTPEELSKKAAVYIWDNTTSIIVADGYIQADIAKAVIMSAIDGIPVLYEQIGNESIEDICDLLGVGTVYVTPAVDPDIISALETKYTVNDTWHGLTGIINKSVEEFILDAQPYKNATFVIAKDPIDATPYDEFLYVMGVYNQANITVVMAKNSTTLGVNQTTFLQNEDPAMVVLLGGADKISESLSTTVAAALSKVPWRITYDDAVDEITQLALAASGYYYPVVVVSYTQSNNTFTYYFKNVGFSDVIKFDTYSLRVTFTKSSGDFINSNPYPTAQNDTRVVYEFKDPIYPHDYVVLIFSVTEGTNFSLIPEADYYSATLAGTVKPLTSFYDYIASYFEKAKSWFADMFSKVVGILSVYIPLPNYAIIAIAALITFVIVWSIVGLLIYIAVVALGRKVEHPAYYGLIAWVIEQARRGR